MSLSKYNQKRNFKSTAEPEGKAGKSKKELIFVVQKHAASHLHYDFRLELDGTLKSWAVPKGPSINPEDKRLAMMVEDHPYNYKDFEGNIPKGNYGAGNVIVWDNGIYTAKDALNEVDGSKKIKAGLLKGHIAIILKGKKLKGEFDLVQLKGKQENAWLLIKKKDRYAKAEDILKKNKSVLTNVTLETLNKKSTSKENSGKTPLPEKKIIKIKKAAFVKPMLADTIASAFDRKGWVFEIKYDGYRTIAVINKEKVELFSRNQLSFNTKFKSIALELKKIKHQAVLDGEVVIEDEKGRSDFQLLQNYQKTGQGILKYYVFDIMNLDGRDTLQLSLLQRKELTKMLLSKNKLVNIFYSEHIEEKGNSFFKLAVKNNYEGIMAKDGASVYRPGKRSSEWQKIKIIQQEEAIIIGITEPKGTRGYFGALLLAQYDGPILKYIGNCGTGFKDETLKELYAKFRPYFIKSSPVVQRIKLTGKVQWIKPKFIAQVKFSEITQDGFMRHPVYVGLRIDKTLKEVKAKPVKNKNKDPDKEIIAKNSTDNKISAATETDIKIGKIILHLSNQHKMYFPDDKITKGDVINYYNEVADIMLPYLKDRPQSMNRFPNGIDGQSFYQKDVDIEKIPSWLKTTPVFSESNQKEIDYLLCNDKATLLYMANLGCIEINPWNSTVKHIENPDWMVIDLDPEKNDFKEVVNTALVVREVMDELETECYCKTSGSSGLHIYIPLGAKYDYNTVKIFAELIAHTVNVRLPETTTIIRSIQKRNKKIYIDFLQNRHGQTLAAPYSIRPKPGATVSTPLEWSEVNKDLSPSQFTIKNMMKRLEKKGDLWKPVLKKGANLDKIIKKLSVGKIPTNTN